MQQVRAVQYKHLKLYQNIIIYIKHEIYTCATKSQSQSPRYNECDCCLKHTDGPSGYVLKNDLL